MQTIEQLNEKLNAINGYTAKEVFDGEITIYAPFDIGFEHKSFKKPKVKNIDLDWLINKCKYVSLNQNYTNLSNTFEVLKNKLKKDLKIYSYATSYGLGIDTLFTSHEAIHRQKDIVLNYLKNLGVDAGFGISYASWVLQIKISKSKENIKKIESLK